MSGWRWRPPPPTAMLCVRAAYRRRLREACWRPMREHWRAFKAANDNAAAADVIDMVEWNWVAIARLRS